MAKTDPNGNELTPEEIAGIREAIGDEQTERYVTDSDD